MEERVSLIVKIFSDRDQVEMVKNLSGDDAQTFIDVTDEACFHPPPQSVGIHSNVYILSVRHWIGFHQRSTRNVCALYTGFVVARLCFHSRW